MPQISTQEFERVPLRVHDFLAGVPLHDVWSVDLPRARPMKYRHQDIDEIAHVARQRVQ
jgi:hypothetical protein